MTTDNNNLTMQENMLRNSGRTSSTYSSNNNSNYSNRECISKIISSCLIINLMMERVKENRWGQML